MAVVTLATLVARARERADMPVAGFIADSATGMYGYINEGVQKIHDKLVEAYGGDYVETSVTWTSTGSSDIPLPADFYKLLGVDLNLSGSIISLRPYARAERNAYRNTTYLYRGAPTYKLSGNVLRILPAPASGTQGTIWYSPVAPVLTLTTDTVNFPNGWERYAIIYAAIQARMKQEDDVRDLRYELTKMEDELKSLVENRDAANAVHAGDVDLMDVDPRWY